MPSIDTPTIVAIVASTALLYISFSSLPNWARVWTRKDNPDDSKDANDDLANPMAIINKLRYVWFDCTVYCADYFSFLIVYDLLRPIER